ncbi:adenosylhomocysteinase [Methanosalsum natronophilum]|uniref:adenosylhomocysteinase n=1 Tax=Methanosalsum natronophilum TaxID=768733 RepID=UPI002167C762|nr:adenosylhomocysteinase [Methanosalsum natronophilum]MCS3923029.1 adenosylhomocysteinase [Methanosalsum natronophilum]
MLTNDLVESGNLKIEWARQHMPVLKIIREIFEREKPLKGYKIAMALHVEAKTANLVETLVAGGAEVAITGCNPLSTQDDISLALDDKKHICCCAKYAANNEDYYKSIDKVLDINPDITIDDGADLIFKLHTDRRELLSSIKGGCEETTTGIHRLKAMERDGALNMPVIAVNDALTKFLFDNRYGTGQSAWDGIVRTTNLLIAGKTVVIGGYGWCGKGTAMRAIGLGANVIVTEVDSIRALEAKMDGHRVMTMQEAASLGDIFVTTTGNRDILTKTHFKSMKDGSILANSGHFNIEIRIDELEEMATSIKTVRNNIKEYIVDEKKIYVLADGRLVNLAAGDGHPAEVMDMSFANQALCVRYIAEKDLDNGVHAVPESIDRYVAELKLESMNVKIDKLTSNQQDYMNGWDCGT